MTTAEMTDIAPRGAARRRRRDPAAAQVRRRSPPRTCTCPGPDFVDRVWVDSDRSPQRAAQPAAGCSTQGRLAGTGYVSILPVDQGIEHSAGASFAPNPIYFDPENIVKLAIEGGCNAVASTVGVLGAVSRKYAHKIPFIVKLNHNELLTLPQHVRPDHVRLGAARVRAWARPASARRSTSARDGVAPPDRRGRRRPSRRPTTSACSPSSGATCATARFKVDGVDYHTSADLTGQANHLGVTIQADIIKQKLPENNGGYNALQHERRLRQDAQARLRQADDRQPDRPDPLPGGQLLHGPRRPDQLRRRVRRARPTSPRPSRTAVINKRAGGMGLISGRKAFQRPMDEGVALLNAIQDVYLSARGHDRVATRSRAARGPAIVPAPSLRRSPTPRDRSAPDVRRATARSARRGGLRRRSCVACAAILAARLPTARQRASARWRRRAPPAPRGSCGSSTATRSACGWATAATSGCATSAIDTPESVKPRTPVQCFGKAASAANHAAARRARACGWWPTSRRATATAGCWPTSIAPTTGCSSTRELVRGGYATPLTIAPNVRHAARFRALATEARRAGRGLWSACSR